MSTKPASFLPLRVAAAWLVFALLAESVFAVERPNFVIILADDLGYGDLGCYGGTAAQTPCIDRLAAEGMRLTDFHSSGAVCSPTRAGLLTGRYQQRAGVPGVITAAHHRDHGLHPREITFAELLRDAGYATALFGKWHLGYQTKFNPLKHGFEQFRGYVSGNIDYFSHIDQTGVYDWWKGASRIEEEGYSTHLITRHAVEFIDRHHDEPFCLYIAHEAPHYPFQGPGDEADRAVGGKFHTHGSRSDRRAAYAEMLAEMDRGVGEVVAALERHDLAGRTLVFFLSDNGAARFGSNAPWRGRKGTLWEGGHRVPGIAWWPGRIRAGATSDQLAISLDLMPTMLDLAGVRPPAGRQLDGRSLAPLLIEQKPPGDRKLFWGHRGGFAMRDGGWKLIVPANKRRARAPRLFNLAQDPAEKKDLAGEQPKRVKRMLAAIEAWRQDVTPDAARRGEAPAEPALH